MSDTHELTACQACGSRFYRANVAFYILADGRDVCAFCASTETDKMTQHCAGCDTTLDNHDPEGVYCLSCHAARG